MDTINLPRVEKIISSAPLSDLEAFDMMSRFLEAEKAKQLSLDFAGQSYLSASSQIWNDLRLACNSLLEDNDSRREPVAEWKMDVDFETTPTPSKSVATAKSTDKDAKRSAKKEKKEAKKAKKDAKKEKKEAKKARKEIKKRKRE
jgi:hypothetical protein